MRIPRVAVASAVLVLGVAFFAVVRSQRDAHAGDAPSPSLSVQTRLAIVHGDVDGTSSIVSLASIPADGGSVATLDDLGRVDHVAGSARRGVVVGETAFVVVDEPAARKTSYSGALFRVAAGGTARLVGNVTRSSTPMIAPNGHLLVARGSDGDEPSDADGKKLLLRDDALAIDDVDPATGAVTTVWKSNGYLAFLAARLDTRVDGEVAIYWVNRTGASLFALDPATRRTHPLAPSIPPFARDFSFDPTHRALVFADFATPGAATCDVMALDLRTGAQTTLFSTHHDHPMPFALPSGALAFSSDGDHGVALRSPNGDRTTVVGPLGEGSDTTTHVDASGRWLSIVHLPASPNPGEPPHVAIVDLDSPRHVVRLPLPGAEEAQPIGFVTSAGAAR